MSLPTASLDISNLFSVSSLRVVVTGGGKGIGAMISSGFVMNGADVLIVGREEKSLIEHSNQLNAIPSDARHGGNCRYLVGDLSSIKGIDAFVKSVREDLQWDSVNVLINNSGVAWGEPLERYSEKGWDRVMDLNVKSIFFLTQRMLPLLIQASTPEHPSRIINVGSTAGLQHQPVPTYAYDISKAAVHHLTKKLAMDLGKRKEGKILVNAIAPGLVPSKMSNSLKIPPEMLQNAIPLGRPGAPSDLAALAIFLACKGSNWITGAIVPIDGGQTVNTPKMSKL